MDSTTKLFDVCSRFKIEGELRSIERYGEGHINVTYLVVTSEKCYIMQKMNTRVFPNSDGLIANIYGVTEHLRAKGVETLELIFTTDGKPYIKGEECWRMYAFIENSVAYQSATPELFAASGEAFGRFQSYLADYDASKLCEVIENFHNTADRYRIFKAALAEDKLGRAAECKSEIEAIVSHGDTYSTVVDALAKGIIPSRVTHNDTKLNNILMDADSGEARAIIDLDTIMPGSMLYDFGDSIRFGANTAAEDEPDTSKVGLDMSLFLAYAKGYITAVKDSITEAELDLLPFGAYLMTIECGMRFLTDYLVGDTYFATKYQGHNLVRARAQIALALDIEAHFSEMRLGVREIYNSL